MITLTEENYIKAIFHLGKQGSVTVSTNALAEAMNTKASSATDMIKKLAEKNYANYKKYQGVSLTADGKRVAVNIIRKHRLWEVFLVDKLNFTWDQVHDVAEQLEHIKSQKLIDELDAFLDFPTHDPHGDPIPDKQGKFEHVEKTSLSNAKEGVSYVCVGVNDSSVDFLKYLDNNAIALGTVIKVLHKEPFDHSIKIKIDGKELMVSQTVGKNLFLKEA
ncbi:metal-dependent transcriptional regulator [Gelidibacter salicanalis]|uniref:Transcriptional regulator MntR n=1 Tax=Gelidibacter salicanalis TaxID=291193 RepID=A0A934NHH7_9FLAO|nr:metal-dependent transcriptional regulator [Gelidibacter salicanalis]MBJ7879763.1 metal-dependent transcriptional regulator [Gelidibacter salicanalis]